MQYIWNAIAWFRCSTSVPVNPGDAPSEPPKESKTLSGWKAWASTTKTKIENVVEDAKEAVKEVEDVAKAVEKTVEDVKDAAKEVADVVDAVKTGDITAIKKEVSEAVTTVSEVKTSLDTIVEETKEAVEETKETVEGAKEVVEDVKQKVEETKELIEDSKKKVTEKREDGEKDLGDDFVPYN